MRSECVTGTATVGRLASCAAEASKMFVVLIFLGRFSIVETYDRLMAAAFSKAPVWRHNLLKSGK